MLDAITLALYGDTCRKAEPKEALSYGAEEGLAECEFEAKNRRFLAQWRVRQTRSKKVENRLKTERSVAEWDEKTEAFHIIAERRVREVNALIEKVTGLDFARFRRSVLLAQGEFAAFLRASEKERSDLLERITGTEIYSELSKAALQRKNLEHEKLTLLTTQRGALQLLSKEEIKEKKAELKTRKANEKENRAALTESKANLERLQLVNRLRQRKEDAEASKVKLNDERSAMQADLDRLDAHRKTLPLHPDLARLDDKLDEAKKLKQETVKVGSEAENLEAKVTDSEQKLQESKSVFELLRSEQKSKLKLFEEVVALDGKIAHQQSNFAKLKSQLTQISDKHKQLTKSKLSTEKTIETNKKEIARLSDWLAENQAAEDLSKDLPLIKNFRNSLRENLYAQRKTEKSVEDFSKRLGKTKKSVDETEKKWIAEKSKLEQLTIEFQKKTPEEITLTRHDLLEKLGHEIDSADKRHESLRKLQTLNEDYRKLLAEASALEEELDNFRREEMALDKWLLSVVEAVDEAETFRNFKQEIYRQQLHLASFEQARSELKEGEPCPVCLSTEHPFRGQEVTPFVNEAKLELESAEAALAKLNKERNGILRRHLEIASAIHQIDSSTSGRLGKLNDRIHEQEQKMAALFPKIDGEEFSNSTGENLLNRLSNFEADLASKKAVRTALTKLNTQITRQEEVVGKLENEQKILQSQQRQLRENLANAEQNLAEQKKKFDATAKDLNGLVGKYGYRFSIEKANGMFTELEAKEQEFSKKKTAHGQLERQLELAEQSLSTMVKSEAELIEQLSKLEGEALQEEKSLKLLTDSRLEKFEDKNPQAERESFLKKMEDAEQTFGNAKTAFEELNSALKISRQKKKDLEKRLEKNEVSVTKLTEKLKQELTTSGFDSLEILRSAILDEAEAAQIQHQAESFQKRQIEVEQDLKTLTAELKTALATPLPEQSIEELTAEVKDLEAISQKIQQSIGALQQQLTDNSQRSEESKRLLTEIDEQRKTYNRWLALYDLIGSSDGKKFRIFAQGLTLAKLVQLANVHLANLNGRYLIVKRHSEDLELDIVDTYQADNVRSMHTLSGGESFLVSLALALGLSDLAGRNANIRSLFIDEGFGMLDDQALDIAISTLENLQASGKTIGVISHVKELKERISAQVRLVKKGGGMSEVEVLG